MLLNKSLHVRQVHAVLLVAKCSHRANTLPAACSIARWSRHMPENVTASELLEITLDHAGTEKLLALPPPEHFDFGSGAIKERARLLEKLVELWHEILSPSLVLSPSKLQQTCANGHVHTLEPADIRASALLSICAYYDHSLRLFLATDGAGLPAGFPLANWGRFHERETLSKCNSVLRSLRLLSSFYFQTVFAAHFTQTLKRTPLPPGLVAVFESSAHSGLNDLFNLSGVFSGRYEGIAARRLMSGALELVAQAYAKEAWFNKEHKPGPFSSIRLDELALLASRDASTLKRYGERRVEKVFEGQLALIIQSFGMYVVSTDTGRRTVDLVCLSGIEERMTFLVEAKSSKKPYTLPTKDARALKEYVADIRRSLPTLPTLRFVLVVAHAPAARLEKKLAQLEADAGIPLRFLKAQQLADLRESITGPMPMRIFSEQILQSTHILGTDFVSSIVKGYNAEQDAHKQFVESMLAARGVIQIRKEWGPIHDETSPPNKALQRTRADKDVH
jgi:hypothetical protein